MHSIYYSVKMPKTYSNQFPIGKKPVGNKPPQLWNIELWSGGRLLQTIYMNAPYAICKFKAKGIIGAKVVKAK